MSVYLQHIGGARLAVVKHADEKMNRAIAVAMRCASERMDGVACIEGDVADVHTLPETDVPMLTAFAYDPPVRIVRALWHALVEQHGTLLDWLEQTVHVADIGDAASVARWTYIVACIDNGEHMYYIVAPVTETCDTSDIRVSFANVGRALKLPCVVDCIDKLSDIRGLGYTSVMTPESVRFLVHTCTDGAPTIVAYALLKSCSHVTDGVASVLYDELNDRSA